jgi:hypothetical protein
VVDAAPRAAPPIVPFFFFLLFGFESMFELKRRSYFHAFSLYLLSHVSEFEHRHSTASHNREDDDDDGGSNLSKQMGKGSALPPPPKGLHAVTTAVTTAATATTTHHGRNYDDLDGHGRGDRSHDDD